MEEKVNVAYEKNNREERKAALRKVTRNRTKRKNKKRGS